MSSTSLKLFFDERSLELQRVVFDAGSQRAPIVSVRGKTSGAYRDAASFQWTQAVKAMSELLERTSVWAQSGCHGEAPAISGGRGSPALSFDYAISRAADWIVEMFGADSFGAPLARKIFIRSNSELKRPGPVTITLNHRFISAKDIATSVVSGEPFENNAADLLPFDLKSLKSAFVNEISEMLRVTPLFDQSRKDRGLAKLASSPLMRRLTNKPLKLSHVTDQSLTSGARLGAFAEANELKKLLEEVGGLTVGVTPSQAGSIAILRFLKSRYGLPLNVDYRFAHTSEMIQSAGSADVNRPNAFVISVPSWAMMQKRYKEAPVVPLMIMPSASHRIMSARGAKNADTNLWRGRFSLMSDFPTTPGLYFEDLLRSVGKSRRNVSVSSTTPDETMRELAEDGNDLRAVLWFPHDVFSFLVHGCTALDTRSPELSPIDNILVISRAVAQRPKLLQLLDVAIRDGWLTLVADAQQRSVTANGILSDSRYIQYLTRFSGLLNVSRTTVGSTRLVAANES